MDKRLQLLKLVEKRKCNRWKGYYCVGDYHNVVFECDFVSPYTKGAHNFDSDIMVMLQDWACHEELSRKNATADPIGMKVGHDPNRQTNKKLKRLLKDHFEVELKDVYATNLFPFVKIGGMSAKIPPHDLRRAAEEFALPQIKIVCPKLVVCLGLDTFKAICFAADKRQPVDLASAIEAPFWLGKSLIWCQAHPGGRASNRSAAQISLDWKQMANAIKTGQVVTRPATRTQTQLYEKTHVILRKRNGLISTMKRVASMPHPTDLISKLHREHTKELLLWKRGYGQHWIPRAERNG